MTMALKVHDTLTRELRPFEPIEASKVRMYVCGITVYDYCHIGHARMNVVFDMIARWFRASGYDLTYARNITDIDDKIVARANDGGESFDKVVERFTAAMYEDFEPLGILRPDLEPRATTSMEAIVAMIERLIANGHAYAADNGDVYFDVSTFDGYGRLSGKRPADLRAGARVEINEAKSDALDFVLWKAAKPGEPSWDSPWGKGRPGWHIECSAMSTAALGDEFDIHGGGADLVFPHHENEIAQSVGATHAPFARYWLHNGFVNVDEEKMSKSLGNFFTIREVLKKYPGEVIRAFILMSHYRSPVNYSDQSLDSARAALDRLYTALRGLPVGATQRVATGEEYRNRFTTAMNDDFNTPVAFSVLFDLAREVNRLRDADPATAVAHASLLRELGGILGFLEQDPEAWFKGGGGSDALGDKEIESLIAARLEARTRKDFAEADRIRDQLKAAGVILEDGAAGTTWKRF